MKSAPQTTTQTTKPDDPVTKSRHRWSILIHSPYAKEMEDMAELKHVNANAGTDAVVEELLSSGGVIVDDLLEPELIDTINSKETEGKQDA